jgi:hypothetical protein
MIRRLVSIVFVALAGVAVGCDSVGGCSAGQMRCHGNRAEMCSASNGWELWQDCSVVGESCGNGPAACFGYDVACCR